MCSHLLLRIQYTFLDILRLLKLTGQLIFLLFSTIFNISDLVVLVITWQDAVDAEQLLVQKAISFNGLVVVGASNIISLFRYDWLLFLFKLHRSVNVRQLESRLIILINIAYNLSIYKIQELIEVLGVLIYSAIWGICVTMLYLQVLKFIRGFALDSGWSSPFTIGTKGALHHVNESQVFRKPLFIWRLRFFVAFSTFNKKIVVFGFDSMLSNTINAYTMATSNEYSGFT